LSWTYHWTNCTLITLLII